MSEFVIESITELFHFVRSLIPEEQDVLCVSPDTTVSEAIQKMEQHHFSQLPVVEGNAVLGVFSYRSFATRLLRMGQLKAFPGDVTVDEFVERFNFVQLSDNWEHILSSLDTDDAVLVGSHNQLDGIVTTMDVLSYLRKVASPFVLIAEIETSLRRVIRACVNEEELRLCAANGLSKRFQIEEDEAVDLTKMTFNDYAQIIGSRENWPYFTVVFGETDWSRSSTMQKLIQIRMLRNDVFHFKRKLEQQDIQHLTEFRDWLQLRARAFEARQQHEKATPTPSTQDQGKRQWDESSFMDALGQNHPPEEVAVARKILEWAKEQMPGITWGTGKVYGSFTPGLSHKGVWHQAISVWTNSYVELKFDYMQGRPVFDDDQERLELIDHFNQVPDIYIDEGQVAKRPWISLSILTNDQSLKAFLQVLNWYVDKIKLQKSGLPHRRVLRYQFWDQHLDKAREKTSIHANISPSRDHWVSASSGLRGVLYNYLILKDRARVELYIDRGKGGKHENKQIFNELYKKRDEIEARFGDSLSWEILEDRRASAIRYEIKGRGGLRAQEAWPDLQDYMIDTMIKFSEAMQPEINQISL